MSRDEPSADARRTRFFDLSLDGLCIVDESTTFVDVSPAWERALGYTSDELVGRSFMEFVHPDDVERTIAETASLVSGTVTTAFENRYRAKDGTYRSFLWSATFEPGARLFYAVARDVTQWRQSHEFAALMRDAERRRQEALEINDAIVQGLVVSLHALHERRYDLALDAIERTLASARTVVDGLLSDVPLEPGSFVRSKPAVLRGEQASEPDSGG